MRRVAIFGVIALGFGCSGSAPIDSKSRNEPQPPWPPTGADLPRADSWANGTGATAWSIVDGTDLPWPFERGEDVAEGDEGATFIAGAPQRGYDTANRYFSLLKVSSDGTPDQTFGNEGLAISFAAFPSVWTWEVLALPGIEVTCGVVLGEDASFAMARLDAFGSPIGPVQGENATAGELLIHDATSCRALAGGPDFKYVAGAELKAGPHAVWRFNYDGSLDSGFGTDGRAIIPDLDPEGTCCVADLSVGVDGAIYAAVDWGYVFKLRSDGSLETSFGSGGYALAPGRAESVQVDSAGQVYVVGSDAYEPFIARYSSDGVLDHRFGSDGVLRVPRHGFLEDADVTSSGFVAVGVSERGGLLVRLRLNDAGELLAAPEVLDFPLQSATRFHAVEAFRDGSFVMSGFDPLLFRHVPGD